MFLRSDGHPLRPANAAHARTPGVAPQLWLHELTSGALIFGYLVGEPRHYGVLEFDAKGRATGIEEKPDRPKSSYAVPGFYAYDARVVEFSRAVTPPVAGNWRLRT